jgi:putative protein-disulfide isomerase
MCSWCWGFSKVIRKITRQINDRAAFSILMGGLRFQQEPMTDELKQSIRKNWCRVHDMTGQTFNFGLLESTSFVYNTEPACRAVVVARSMRDDGTALKFFDRLQAAFYKYNIDITDAGEAALIAATAGIDAPEFREQMVSMEESGATQADFDQTHELGVTGFPTIIVIEDERAAYLTRGYQPYHNLQHPLERWLESGIDRL